MSTVQYSDYKEAVYDNLITGIVYGEGQETSRSSQISKSWRPANDHRRISRSIRCLGLCPPVSYPFKCRTIHDYSGWHSGENRVSPRLDPE